MAIPKKTFQFKIVLVLKVFNILHNLPPNIFRPKHSAAEYWDDHVGKARFIVLFRSQMIK